jgi:hypothetical protein
VKRTPLKRTAPLRSRTGLGRATPNESKSVQAFGTSKLKRGQPRRDWSSARAKVEAEGCCRLAHADDPCEGPLEAAHVIGREHDRPKECPSCLGMRWGDGESIDCSRCKGTGVLAVLFVSPPSVAPLCRRHHRLYDAGERDLLGKLTLVEELQAVADCSVNGGPGVDAMRRRTCPSVYRVDKLIDAKNEARRA